jgi:hypothetical protein
MRLTTDRWTTGQVIDQGIQDNLIRYEVVDVNANVVSALSAEPAESFHRRFGNDGKPPAPKIGIGDTVSVSIWDAEGDRWCGRWDQRALRGARTCRRAIDGQYTAGDGAPGREGNRAPGDRDDLEKRHRYRGPYRARSSPPVLVCRSRSMAITCSS